MKSLGMALLTAVAAEHDAKLVSLQQIRKQMEHAVGQQDWQSVLRMDRLCAQVIDGLKGQELNDLQKFVDEMLKIKKLYARAIQFLNREMLRLPNQAI